VGRWRSLAYVTVGSTTLVSRNGNPFRSFPELASLLSFDVNADDAVLDGEIVKLDETGRPQFYDLMRRRGPFQFVAFDVLDLSGKEVRNLPLTERKRLLRAIIPAGSSSLLYAQHVAERGRELFAEVCAQDLEGVVAKHRESSYGSDESRHSSIHRVPNGSARFDQNRGARSLR
jgi:bifunctional non-homologous end joining protein LigD